MKVTVFTKWTNFLALSLQSKIELHNFKNILWIQINKVFTKNNGLIILTIHLDSFATISQNEKSTFENENFPAI